MKSIRLQTSFRNIFLVIVIGLLLLILATHIRIGTNIRLASDDFCQSNMAINLGAWNAAKAKYLNWEGRYSYFFIFATVPINKFFVPILPGLVILLWVSGLYALFHKLFQGQGSYQRKAYSAFLSTLLPVAAITFSDNIFESLYWKVGVMTYTLPIVLFIWFLNLALYAKNSRKSLLPVWHALGFLLTFILAGFSPVFVVIGLILLTLIGAAVRLFFFENNKTLFYLLLSGWAGMLIGFIVYVSAPGNAARIDYYSPNYTLFSIILDSISSAFNLYKHLLSEYTLLTALVFLVPFCVFALDSQKLFNLSTKALLWVEVVAAIFFLGLTVASFVPGYYAMGIQVPERAIIIPKFLSAVYMAQLGAFFGILLKKLFTFKPMLLSSGTLLFSAVVLVLAVYVLGYTAQNEFNNLKKYQAYAEGWDAREALILSSTEKDMVVAPLPHSLVDKHTLTPSADHWINACIAIYYDLDTIVAATP